MGIESFKMIFNNPEKMYFPGDTLKVHLVVVSKSGFKLNEISYKLEGTAKTYWYESGSIEDLTSRGYHGYIKYFDIRCNIYQKPDADSLEIPAGQYSYRIAFEIPEGIPPSFQGKRGSVEYRISATMDRPWRCNKTISEKFIIKTIFDLNRYPSLKVPRGVSLERNFGCYWNMGQIRAIVAIPQTGYVVGEVIPVKIFLDNFSSCDVKDIIIKLIRSDIFYSTDLLAYTETFKTVKSMQSLGMKIKSKDSDILNLDYTVPKVSTVNMMDGEIIHIRYLLTFEFVLSGLAFNMRGQIPIYIGNVPINVVDKNGAYPDYHLLPCSCSMASGAIIREIKP